MARWSIRARLTLWYSVILLAGLAVFGEGIWLVVAHSLMAALDDGLTAQAKGVITVIHTEFDPAKPEQLYEELSEYADATPEGNLMEVLDSRGNPIVSSKVLHLPRTARGLSGWIRNAGGIRPQVSNLYQHSNRPRRAVSDPGGRTAA